MISSYSIFVAFAVIACLLIGVGCENNHNNGPGPASNKGNSVTQMNAEFEIAINSDRPYEARIISALKLNNQDRLHLQELLLSRLVGNYSSEAIDDLLVLAEIGDEYAVNNLKQIIALDRENDILVPGRINSARKHAIEKIKVRQ
jgi:hypothetical protein